jgi:hypothetical protein
MAMDGLRRLFVWGAIAGPRFSFAADALRVTVKANSVG